MQRDCSGLRKIKGGITNVETSFCPVIGYVVYGRL